MTWPTVALLVAIMVLEGARRVGPGDVILRRTLFGTWDVARTPERRWSLVSWLPPLWTTIVITAPSTTSADVSQRLAAVRPWYLALQWLGAATALALLAGVPLAERRFTAVGVVLAIALVLALAAATTLAGVVARRRLGLPRLPALAALSPFGAPYAAERLLEHVLAGLPAESVARALISTERFHAWIRPRVYDADALAVRGLADRERAAILAPPLVPDGDAAALYCPRCAAVYRDGATCADCPDIALRPLAAAAP